MTHHEGPDQEVQALFGPGRMVDQFRIIRLAARGGMGNVYLARDSRLGRRVALKVLRPSAISSAEEVQRFLDEARTTARFNHPHIVTVFSAGLHGGFPYLALEYLDGHTLRERLDQGRVSPTEALRLSLAIAEALQEAHLHGVLHRDLKPENAVIPTDGRIRVVDFGLAEVMARPVEAGAAPADPALVSTSRVAGKEIQGTLQGTPAYMAPEQWLGQGCSPTSDIWALGVTMHELLTGRRPFEAPSLVELAARVAGPTPAPRLPEASGVDPEVAEMVVRCLDKEPTCRPQAAEVAEILRRVLARAQVTLPAEQCPFRGLQPFTEEQAGLFFGRHDELNAFLERMRGQAVLPLVGPSGVGKTSFVQAGIIPRLREQGPWMVALLRPGSRPFETLAARLAPLLQLAGQGAQLDQETWDSPLSSPDLPGRPADDESGPATRIATDQGSPGQTRLEDLLVRRLQRSPALLSVLLERVTTHLRCSVLLVVDQLEELCTHVEQPVRQRFMETLCAAADDPLEPVRVIFAVREDFLSQVAAGRGVREVLEHVVVMRTPDPVALEEILVQPVRVAGYSFEDPDLVQEMICEAGREPSSLPLLQFAARMLWERRNQERRLLTRAAYQEMGGVAGALAAHADGVLQGLSAQDEALVQQILLRLVTPQGTRRVLTRSRVQEGLGDAAGDLVNRLVRARLLAVLHSGEAGGEEPELELVHESLLSGWGRLARWIERGREDLAFLDEVGQAADLWERRGQRAEELWQGEALADGLRALRRCSEPVPKRVTQFLEAGQCREKRRVWTRRGLVALAALVAAGVMALLVQQRKEADRQRVRVISSWVQVQQEGARSALARGDLLEARARLRAALEVSPVMAGQDLWWRLGRTSLVWTRNLGASAYRVSFSPDGRSLAVAWQGRSVQLLDRDTGSMKVLRGFSDQVMSVAHSGSGRSLAVGAWSGKVVVQDLVQGRRRVLGRLDGQINEVAFSRDERWLAAAGSGGDVLLWDLVQGQGPRRLGGHLATVTSLAFSPDSRLLATSSKDSTIRVWRTCSDLGQEEPQVLRGHSQGVSSVSFGPESELLASGSYDRTVRIWRLAATGSLPGPRVLRGHNSVVLTVAFSPDGQNLASAGYDRVVRIWNLARGVQEQALDGHSDLIWDLAYSPDGQNLASASRDGTVRLWSVRHRSRPQPQRGHIGRVYSASFIAGGRQVVSGGTDGVLRRWDVASGAQLDEVRASTDWLRSVRLAPDGRKVILAGHDSRIAIWRPGSGRDPEVLALFRSRIYDLACSPDSRSLAVAGAVPEAWIVDAASGDRVLTLRGHDNTISSIDYSPDGKLLATGSEDSTVRIWDASTGAPGAVLRGHTGGVEAVRFSPDSRILASAGQDGTVRLWQSGTWEDRVVDRGDARAYGVAFHPGGGSLGIARSDGTATILDLATFARKVLRGHLDEVNGLELSPDGSLVATWSDDGTVRLWETSSGRPRWRGPILLPSPPLLLTHQGWIAMDRAGGGSPALPRTTWRTALEDRARLAGTAGTAPDQTLCVYTHDSALEMWDTATDTRLLDLPGGSVQRLLAMPQRCLVLAGGELRIYSRKGPGPRMPATALAADDSEILVASGRNVLVLTPEGKELHRYEVGEAVTALARAGDLLVLGFADGSVESLSVAPDHDGEVRRLAFEQTPSGPVMRIIQGPHRSLVAGYRSGAVAIWSLDNQHLMEEMRLHGPVIHLLADRGRVYAATELGDHLSEDLSLLRQDPCVVLRQLWREVPVIWQGGRPVRRPPPPGHRCLKKGGR